MGFTILCVALLVAVFCFILYNFMIAWRDRLRSECLDHLYCLDDEVKHERTADAVAEKVETRGTHLDITV